MTLLSFTGVAQHQLSFFKLDMSSSCFNFTINVFNGVHNTMNRFASAIC